MEIYCRIKICKSRKLSWILQVFVTMFRVKNFFNKLKQNEKNYDKYYKFFYIVFESNNKKFGGNLEPTLKFI